MFLSLTGSLSPYLFLSPLPLDPSWQPDLPLTSPPALAAICHPRLCSPNTFAPARVPSPSHLFFHFTPSLRVSASPPPPGSLSLSQGLLCLSPTPSLSLPLHLCPSLSTTLSLPLCSPIHLLPNLPPPILQRWRREDLPHTVSNPQEFPFRSSQDGWTSHPCPSQTLSRGRTGGSGTAAA